MFSSSKREPRFRKRAQACHRREVDGLVFRLDEQYGERQALCRGDGLDDLRAVLAAHIERYPLMDIQDAAKLLYQHHFGNSHLLFDLGAAYSALVGEYASVRQTDAPLLEDIGGGYVRLDLHALQANGVGLTQTFDWMCRTAASADRDIDRFVASLELLREPDFGFDPVRVGNFMEYYKNSGYSPIHHSARYVAAYAPAYRVIRAEFAKGRL